jgi:glutaredoxin-like protein
MSMLYSTRNLEGKRVANVRLKTRTNNRWTELSTDDLFRNRSVIAFSLPAATTPAGASAHLARYRELAAAFRANGVDAITCLSADEAFVTSQSMPHAPADGIAVLFDAGGGFTAGMRFMEDNSSLDFRKRTWRYFMLVKDGVIAKMFIEPDKKGDSFGLSDADILLKYINPKVAAPEPVVIFTKPGCAQSARAKALLDSGGYLYDEISLGEQITMRTPRAIFGSGTWPQVFIGGRLIGGADQLEDYCEARKAA